MSGADLGRIADVLEQIAEQSAPWKRTNISAPVEFTDRHGNLIAISVNHGNSFAITGTHVKTERLLFVGTWPQCRRQLDRLFIEDVTARALAAPTGKPSKPVITWRPAPHGGFDGVASAAGGRDARAYLVGQIVAGDGSRDAYVRGVGEVHALGTRAGEDAAKALCEACEREFLKAAGEPQT